MCSPASVILASIVTILVSFKPILIYLKAKCWKITLKLTSIVTILANVALAGEHIFQVLGQYS